MPNNISVSITADVADLTAKRAVLSAELKTATADLNAFAKSVQTTGSTDALRTSMLASADSVAKTRAQIRLVDTEVKNLTRSTVEETAATVASTGAHVSSRASFEALVLVHEALRGNFTRMAGSALIEAQAMAGAEASAAAFAAVLSPLGLGIIATGAALIATTVVTLQYQEAQRQLLVTSVGMGAASRLTAQQLDSVATSAAATSAITVGAGRSMASALAAVGVESQQTATEATEALEPWAKLTGEKLPDAQKELAEALKDPAKGAEDLSGKISFLDSSERNNIETLARLGEKTQAQAELTRDLKNYTDQASAATGGLASGMDILASAASRAANELAEVVTWEQRLGQVIADRITGSGGSAAGAALGAQLADNAATGVAAKLAPASPYEQRAQQLTGEINALQKGIPLESDAGQRARDTEALHERLTALQSLKPAADIQHQQSLLEVEDLKAKTAAQKASIAEQKETLALSGQVMSDAERQQKIADAGAVAGTRQGEKHKRGKHGPDEVAEWREQLEAQEVASDDYFGDQTQKELDFWNTKVGLTKKGSREWLEVQREIFNDSRTLARQNRDDALAIEKSVDEEIQKDLHTRAEIVKDRNTEALAELRSNLDTARSIREADSREQESEIEARAKYAGPLGGVGAAKQEGLLHQQMLARQMADDAGYHAAQDRLLQDDINIARQTYGEQSAEYTKAVDAKKLADQQFANQHKALEDQMVNQAKEDAQKIRTAWHTTIDPMVSTTGEQIKGLIEGTESWGQALQNIGESALSLVVEAIEHMVEEWLVSMIVGKAATSATGASNVASYAAQAGAAGVASMAGAPFPIDLGAPAFGESMAAAAGAFGVVASAAGGWDRVPSDQLAMIHQDEMVMSADIADPARSFFRSLGSGGGTGGGGGDVHNHLHYNPVYQGAPPAERESHADAARRLDTMARRGMLSRRR